jgi:hypothetical protein
MGEKYASLKIGEIPTRLSPSVKSMLQTKQDKFQQGFLPPYVSFLISLASFLIGMTTNTIAIF